MLRYASQPASRTSVKIRQWRIDAQARDLCHAGNRSLVVPRRHSPGHRSCLPVHPQRCARSTQQASIELRKKGFSVKPYVDHPDAPVPLVQDEEFVPAERKYWLIRVLVFLAVAIGLGWLAVTAPKDSKAAVVDPPSCLPPLAKGEVGFGEYVYPTSNVFTQLRFYQDQGRAASGYKAVWCIRAGGRNVASGYVLASAETQLNATVNFRVAHYKALRRAMMKTSLVVLETRFVTTGKNLKAVAPVIPHLHVEDENFYKAPPEKFTVKKHHAKSVNHKSKHT